MRKTVTTSASSSGPRKGLGVAGVCLALVVAVGVWLLATDESRAPVPAVATSGGTNGGDGATTPVENPGALAGNGAVAVARAGRRGWNAPIFFAATDSVREEDFDADAILSLSPDTMESEENASGNRVREPGIFEQLRNHRSKPIPEEVRELAGEIMKDCTNEASKARAIYDWLTANITYDTAEWRNIVAGADDYIHPHDPASVLQRGTTVCIGYAWLFDNLCTSAGLESTFLIGDVRGYRGTADEELVSSVRHAWSAVREEDGWKLLDATWGAKQAGETDADYKGRADYYFDTPPDQFVFDHLPEDADWQLLENPVPSKSAFSILPNLKPAFFTDGLKLGGEYTSVLGAKTDERYRLGFGKPEGTEVLFTLGPASNGEASQQIRSVTSASGKAVSAIIPPLSRGDHLLRVYSRRGEGPFVCGADFVIHAE
jgi:transglutaminase-like putative cysteine protease